MNKPSTTCPHAATSLDERRRRSAAIDEAITAVTIDGLSISTEAEAALDAWERGLVHHAHTIDDPTASAHGQPTSSSSRATLSFVSACPTSP